MEALRAVVALAPGAMQAATLERDLQTVGEECDESWASWISVLVLMEYVGRIARSCFRF